jgi:hypothetical protein
MTSTSREIALWYERYHVDIIYKEDIEKLRVMLNPPPTDMCTGWKACATALRRILQMPIMFMNFLEG